MGHDLDQVMRHAPAAVAALRAQRDLLNDQIVALEKMMKAHEEVALQYKVTDNGNVEDVQTVKFDPSLVGGPSIEERRSLRERVLKIMEDIGDPVSAPDVWALLDSTATIATVRTTMVALSNQKKIERVERGVYRAKSA
jgi:hypothetical protein